METYIIILILSLAGLVLALVLAGIQVRRERAVWYEYTDRLRQDRLSWSSAQSIPHRPLTVVRIDPLELELLLRSPEDNSTGSGPGIKSSASLLGTRTPGAGPVGWPEIHI